MLYNEKYGQGIYSECLRKIKVNLRYTLLNGKNKIIAITSSNMAEGKSTISANLAFSLSQEGKKVLLIETNGLKNHHQASGITSMINVEW